LYVFGKFPLTPSRGACIKNGDHADAAAGPGVHSMLPQDSGAFRPSSCLTFYFHTKKTAVQAAVFLYLCSTAVCRLLIDPWIHFGKQKHENPGDDQAFYDVERQDACYNHCACFRR
jgi:hypothetical protein